MPPPRFKAVCTETGRESKPFGLTERVRGAFRDPDICIFMSDEFEMPRTDKDHELCQSTGLTDSRGVEVFEGDIILVYFPKTDEGYFYSVFFDRGGFKLEGFYFPDQEKPGGQRHWLGVEVLLDAIEGGATLCFVGNRRMPAEELKARAEAVSNG